MRRFTSNARARLLAVPGIGPTVIARLEQVGIATLRELASVSTEEVVTRIARHVGSTCWRNSPQAQRAIAAAIDMAREAAPPPS